MAQNTNILLFISHSSTDRELAAALIELFRSALNLPASAIRCTSVDGYRLPGGADTNAQLRQEVHDAVAFIGIVSPASAKSSYVLFELGARWGAGRPLVPLLAAGAPASLLAGPVAGLNALRCDSAAQLHQLVAELGVTLGITPQRPDAYQVHLERVVSIPPSVTIESEPTRNGASSLRRPLNLEERDTIAAVPSDARELLIAAASDDSGAVFVAEAMQGVSISVGEKEFTSVGNARSEAKWRRALGDLEQLGLIENRGGDGSLLSVTDEGFRVADLLQPPKNK